MANTGNTQQQINYGASANDGQGDPLRTAFIKTDDNFDNVWLAGPVGSNITIGNNTIQSNNTNGNIVLKPNGTGIVQANASIIPNADGVRDLGSSALAWRRAYIDELLPTDLTVSGDAVINGNLTVQGDTIQIGNITTDTLTIQLANTAANAAAANGAGITVGANDNIATILYNSTANRWNVSVGMSAVGNISAPYFSGNGSLLTGITSYGNANVAANLAAFSNNPISTTGTVNTGILSVTGNVTANSAGNVWQWTNDRMSFPSGASWRSDRFTLDEYISSATDGYLNLQTFDNTNNVATELHMEHGIVQVNIYNGNNVTWEFDSTGNLTLPGNTFAVNYANGTPVSISGTYGNANVVANLAAFANNPISTTGNISGNLVAPGGNGQILYNNSGLIGTSPTNFNFDEPSQTLFVKTGSFTGGATGTGSIYAGVPLFTVLGSDVVAQFSGNVDSYTQFNFQNGNSGPLASGDYVITANNGDDDTFFFNMGLTSNNHSDPDFFGDTSTPNDGYLYVVGADSTGPGDTGPGNLLIGSTNGVIKMFVGNTAQANVMQTISSSGVVITGNITAGNVLTGGRVSATGNITGNYILGNGSQLTSINAVTVDITDTNGLTTIYYPTFVENRANAQIARADVDLTYRTDDNLLTVGNVSVTGNITGNTAGFALGYRDIPQVAFTANATIATTDAGKHFYSTQSTDYILTIANNASQGFQVGAAITVVNQGTGNITVAQGSGVTLYLAGNATSSNRTVATFGMATIMKVATDTWFINGTGVS